MNINLMVIARECFTYLGGTENWYIARLFRRRGFYVIFHVGPEIPSKLPVPSIAGVKVGGAGHFIPLIGETANTYITGDPLMGRREWPKGEITKRLVFTGFFMEIRRAEQVRQNRKQ